MHFIRPEVPGTDHDGWCLVVTADLVEQVVAGAIREHQVEQHHIWIESAEARRARRLVLCPLNFVSFSFDLRLQLFAQTNVIFD